VIQFFLETLVFLEYQEHQLLQRDQGCLLIQVVLQALVVLDLQGLLEDQEDPKVLCLLLCQAVLSFLVSLGVQQHQVFQVVPEVQVDLVVLHFLEHLYLLLCHVLLDFPVLPLFHGALVLQVVQESQELLDFPWVPPHQVVLWVQGLPDFQVFLPLP